MTTRSLPADAAKLANLEDSENKIRSAFRRGLEATCAIAKELHKILKGELYKERGYDDFMSYVTDELRIDPRTYRRIIAVSQTISQLQEAGLTLPLNESQAAELARLDPERRARVWLDLITKAEKADHRLRLEDVKRAVDNAEASMVAPAPVRRGTVEVDMDTDNGDEPAPREKNVKGPVVQEVGVVFTERGEAALARIRKLCGDEIADAIESGTVPITEKELRTWAEQPDNVARALSHYVIDKRWTVAKAVDFETLPIEGDTDVSDMLLIAKARGGLAVLNYGEAQITVKLNA